MRRLALHPPQPRALTLTLHGHVHRRGRLGGMVHEDYRAAV
jgi:hypothetical protein